ncbi:MAG: 3-dehydroquinate synthase [Mycobacteriales bacterium]
MTTTLIPVGGDAGYDVAVGTDLLDLLPPLLDGADQVAVVHAPPLAGRAADVAEVLRSAGHRVLTLPVPDGEQAKSIGVASDCWEALGAAGFTRTDAIVGIGGGAVTDLAGFVAAAWLRGVRVVHLPTTLLGMVDAAVGGKTGVNTDSGKNLVGAFHPPAGVLCDLAALRTLPRADLVAGLAEVVKCGFIADPEILDLIESEPAAATDPDSVALRHMIERSVAVKAEVVTGDLREAGRREILNYGHTLAHAIERAEGYLWRHGDAVSVGLVFAAELGVLAGRLDRDTARRHRTVLNSVGLPTAYPGGDWAHLHEAMRVDKKARGSRLRFVVLDGLAKPGILDDPEPTMLSAAFSVIAGSKE